MWSDTCQHIVLALLHMLTGLWLDNRRDREGNAIAEPSQPSRHARYKGLACANWNMRRAPQKCLERCKWSVCTINRSYWSFLDRHQHTHFNLGKVSPCMLRTTIKSTLQVEIVKRCPTILRAYHMPQNIATWAV